MVGFEPMYPQRVVPEAHYSLGTLCETLEMVPRREVIFRPTNNIQILSRSKLFRTFYIVQL